MSAIVPNSARPAADILSAVHFDHSGEFLATGDRGGRVVIFKKSDGGKSKVRRFHKDKFCILHFVVRWLRSLYQCGKTLMLQTSYKK